MGLIESVHRGGTWPAGTSWHVAEASLHRLPQIAGPLAGNRYVFEFPTVQLKDCNAQKECIILTEVALLAKRCGKFDALLEGGEHELFYASGPPPIDFSYRSYRFLDARRDDDRRHPPDSTRPAASSSQTGSAAAAAAAAQAGGSGSQPETSSRPQDSLRAFMRELEQRPGDSGDLTSILYEAAHPKSAGAARNLPGPASSEDFITEQEFDAFLEAQEQREQIAALQQQIAGLLAQVAELERQNLQIPDLHEQIAALQQQIAALQQQIAALRQQIAALQQRQQQHRQQISDLCGHIAVLQYALQQAAARDVPASPLTGLPSQQTPQLQLRPAQLLRPIGLVQPPANFTGFVWPQLQPQPAQRGHGLNDPIRRR